MQSIQLLISPYAFLASGYLSSIHSKLFLIRNGKKHSIWIQFDQYFRHGEINLVFRPFFSYFSG